MPGFIPASPALPSLGVSGAWRGAEAAAPAPAEAQGIGTQQSNHGVCAENSTKQGFTNNTVLLKAAQISFN